MLERSSWDRQFADLVSQWYRAGQALRLAIMNTHVVSVPTTARVGGSGRLTRQVDRTLLLTAARATTECAAALAGPLGSIG